MMNEIEVLSLRRSWDHTAFEHLISDRSRYSVDEGGAHLWIAAQKIYGFLFSLRFRLPSFLWRPCPTMGVAGR